MKKRKYARRRRRLNPRFVIMVLTLAALVTLLVVALVHRDEPDPQPQPEEFVPGAIQPEPDPTTETTTEPTTMPTTGSTTEPTTEPTTGPTEESTEPPAPESSHVGAQIAEIARQQIGKGYLYGGVGPDAFDTSGLVVYCYSMCGVEVPRGAKYQVQAGVEVSVAELEPGDVVFFWTEEPGTVGYEGIYVGNGRFVAARHGDKPVSEMNLWSDYFAPRFLCARRYY